MGQLLTTVAAARSGDPLDLLDQPLWRTLYHFYQLSARDERAALRRRLERVDLGFMVALAFNTPDRLDDEMRKVQQAIADFGTDAVDDATRLARGLALAEKIEAGKVLSDGALQS